MVEKKQMKEPRLDDAKIMWRRYTDKKISNQTGNDSRRFKLNLNRIKECKKEKTRNKMKKKKLTKKHAKCQSHSNVMRCGGWFGVCC